LPGRFWAIVEQFLGSCFLSSMDEVSLALFKDWTVFLGLTIDKGVNTQ